MFGLISHQHIWSFKKVEKGGRFRYSRFWKLMKNIFAGIIGKLTIKWKFWFIKLQRIKKTRVLCKTLHPTCKRNPHEWMWWIPPRKCKRNPHLNQNIIQICLSKNSPTMITVLIMLFKFSSWFFWKINTMFNLQNIVKNNTMHSKTATVAKSLIPFWMNVLNSYINRNKFYGEKHLFRNMHKNVILNRYQTIFYWD